ncbi:hypothetical protein ACQEU8_16685 [Streptomyces sp. CA-250714]
MMHRELQAARQADFLARAAQRRLVREAEQAAKAAARAAADRRKHYLRAA